LRRRAAAEWTINMEWIDRLNKAIIYMEEHMTDEIDYEQAAKIACCSPHHFQRMFAYLANVHLSEYIRRRRMSLAAADLQSGDKKIIDIAMKYGYASPTAFNRAFQSIHGVAPSLIKESGAVLKSFPPISFKITVKGVEEMNFRIEKRDAFNIVGIFELMQKDIEKNSEIVPRMWNKATADGTIEKLAAKMDGQPKGLLGVSICNGCQPPQSNVLSCECGDSCECETWRYIIAVASSAESDGTFKAFAVPAFTWAIFPGEGQGPDIQELEKRIITEWLPTSGYEYANGPDIEVYLTPDPQNMKFEVWLPVTKK